jgi:lysozyme
MTTVNPLVIDISHHNTIDLPRGGFGSVYAYGIRGVIHKASQGKGYRDPVYAPRRKQATDAGLLWGAYHFNTGENVAAQVDNFLRCADPTDATLMALDFEDNIASQMSAQQCVEFLGLLDQKLGRKAVIYGGNRIKEQLPKLGKADQAFIASHQLWLCQYGPVAKIPQPWTNFFLWQFTGDGVGPKPHAIPGIVGNGIDINSYGGTAAQLSMEWAGHVPPDVEKQPDIPAPKPAPLPPYPHDPAPLPWFIRLINAIFGTKG